MSSNNLSQVDEERTPPQANNSKDGAGPKGTSKKKDKKSSGKPTEEGKKKDVNNKKPVLAPPGKPFPPNTELSSEGNYEVLTPEANVEVMADCYSEIDHNEKSNKSLKEGEKDKKKFDVASKLGKDHLDKIRKAYQQDWNSKKMPIKQQAVALYLIDKFALRVGIKGCCSLEVGHIKLHEEDKGQEFVVELDFLEKNSIPYQNKLPVEKGVFMNIRSFKKGKQETDQLFDQVKPRTLNEYLKKQMTGLTAKVFRTYHGSITLQDKLEEFTNAEDSIPLKLLAYKRAVCSSAVLLNHKQPIPKTFDQQMANLQDKIKFKMTEIEKAKDDLKSIQNQYKQSRNEITKLVDCKKKEVESLEDKLAELEMKATYKEESKESKVQTTKDYYLDPRITVAWCKKWNIPVEKVYKKSQKWVLDVEADYKF